MRQVERQRRVAARQHSRGLAAHQQGQREHLRDVLQAVGLLLPLRATFTWHRVQGRTGAQPLLGRVAARVRVHRGGPATQVKSHEIAVAVAGGRGGGFDGGVTGAGAAWGVLEVGVYRKKGQGSVCRVSHEGVPVFNNICQETCQSPV
jgi:hypothetical protein